MFFGAFWYSIQLQLESMFLWFWHLTWQAFSVIYTFCSSTSTLYFVSFYNVSSFIIPRICKYLQKIHFKKVRIKIYRLDFFGVILQFNEIVKPGKHLKMQFFSLHVKCSTICCYSQRAWCVKGWRSKVK